MTCEPSVIIQLQRMGDLILTFPLLARLHALEPQRPLWVVAEPAFFRELMGLTPHGVTYMGPNMEAPLSRTPVHRVVNLSHREEAARLAGRMNSGQRTGIFLRESGLYNKGAWSLYRASIVHNNRHNLFHWADLQALGLVPPAILEQAAWPLPKAIGSGGRVGLFVGASEPEKRPDPAFWGDVARQLLRRGASPVLLGGPGEKGLATAAALHGGLPHTANLAGRFTLSTLSAFFATLDLVVTPDTGPMHLAAWTGVPTLNLSMGPVNAWETAPVPPGHHVLKSTVSCTGCWKCQGSLTCRTPFVPGRVANLVLALLRQDAPPALPGLALYRTARRGGLFELTRLTGGACPQREALGRFWQQWFLACLGGASHTLNQARVELEAYPAMVAHLRKATLRMSAALLTSLKRVNRHQIISREDEAAFWQAASPLARPFSGYLQLLLQNSEYGRAAFEDALALASRLESALDVGSLDSAGPLPLLSVND